MEWKKLLTDEIESNYAITDRLMGMVDEGSLDWKPAHGKNWMTTGQLLMPPDHLLRHRLQGLHHRGLGDARGNGHGRDEARGDDPPGGGLAHHRQP